MSTRHEQCLEALRVKGPLSAMEVARYLHEKGYSQLFERNIAHPRLKELIAQGLVEKYGKKWDPDTERNVSVYRIR
jgi:repressor of nif and glnA expression